MYRSGLLGTLIINVENLFLGIIENFRGFLAAGIKAVVSDFMSDRNQTTQDRAFADDICVGMNIRGAPRIACQLAQILGAAGVVQLIEAIEGFHQRQRIYRAISLTLPQHRLKD